MYVGRIVAIGRNFAGRLCALYRVSSRSFPNREAKILRDKIAILPRTGFEHELNDNPFVAYNCLHCVDKFAFVSNGTHTDALLTKLQSQYSARDALITVLHAFDYEHDALSTPRIAAVVEAGADYGFLGIITKESLSVRRFQLVNGRVFYVATYEHDFPSESFSDNEFDAITAKDACHYILYRGVFSKLEKPVTAACALEDDRGCFEIAVENAK